jgi:coenzyme PQQ precursor peptide PqqA
VHIRLWPAVKDYLSYCFPVVTPHHGRLTPVTSCHLDVSMRWPYREHSTVSETFFEESTVAWETPEFVEIKMDAEINSYQDDFGDDHH